MSPVDLATILACGHATPWSCSVAIGRPGRAGVGAHTSFVGCAKSVGWAHEKTPDSRTERQASFDCQLAGDQATDKK